MNADAEAAKTTRTRTASRIDNIFGESKDFEFADGSDEVERGLEAFIKQKMDEQGVSHALILGHPIMSNIEKTTSWMGSKRTDGDVKHTILT